MAKKLLFLYALVNGLLFFVVFSIEPAFMADRLTGLLTNSVDCLKGQEQVLLTLLRESEMDRAGGVAVMVALPWFVLAGATILHSVLHLVLARRRATLRP